MSDDPGEFELIEEGTSGTRTRLGVFSTEEAARKYMTALTKVGAVWIKRDWGWRTVPANGAPIKEIRRITPIDQPGATSA